MNSSSPLALPRFHVRGLAQTVKGHARLDAEHPTETPFQADLEPQGDASEGDTASPEILADMPPPNLQPEIDTGAILNSLERSIAALQGEALAHANQAICEFIQAAFPRLADEFLAEEVVRELNQTAPPEIERLRICIPSHFEASFKLALQGSSRFQEITDLQIDGDRDELSLDADWREGGVQFDMDRFVKSCLARFARPEAS
ncbi:MAG: hypothetical protein ACX94B_08075 [Henriciella sp.]